MTKRDRIMLSVVAVLAVAGAYYMLLLKPVRAEIAVLDERTAQAEQRRDAALADLSAAKSAREAYRRDTSTLALLGKAVPADDGVPSLLYEIEAAAKAAGVEFDAVKVAEGAGAATPPAGTSTTPTPPAGDASGAAPAGGTATPADPVPGVAAGPEGLSVLPIKITFQGSFFGLERFLDRVHRFARFDDERIDIRGRLLSIEGIALTPGATGLPTLKAEITAQAYVSPTAPASGAAATTASTTTTTTGSGVTG